MTDTNPLLRVRNLGQSIWLDDIQRGMLADGSMAAMIAQDGVAGQTSNPAIFEKAINQTDDYREQIETLARQGLDAVAIYERLVIKDVQDAADLFRGVYEETGGHDGFISLEVSPHLAHDVEGTVGRALELWQQVDRPNLMIKVPATMAGIAAIRTLVAQGINVNATLLFSLDRYRDVADAFIAGLEARRARDLPLNNVASVASFFLSRIDVLVDRHLDAITRAGGDNAETAGKLRGRVAVASARQAYQIYKQMFAGEQWERLATQGARAQRLLWASTSTKDPTYSKVKYVEALIGSNTVNTLPLKTLAAYRESGNPELRLEDALDDTHDTLRRLPAMGIELERVTAQLEDEGLTKFVTPFDKLLATLEQQRAQAAG